MDLRDDLSYRMSTSATISVSSSVFVIVDALDDWAALWRLPYSQVSSFALAEPPITQAFAGKATYRSNCTSRT